MPTFFNTNNLFKRSQFSVQLKDATDKVNQGLHRLIQKLDQLQCYQAARLSRIQSPLISSQSSTMVQMKRQDLRHCQVTILACLAPMNTQALLSPPSSGQLTVT